MTQANLQEFLRRLYSDLIILQEREAKYAGDAPLSLLNQIKDYQHATTQTEQALQNNIPFDQLKAEVDPLIIDIDRVVIVAQEIKRKAFDGRNPYRGLKKFTEDDQEFFFGRTEAVDKLLGKVQYLVDAPTSRELPDLIAVLGASGSGKSSLVRAGLIPALRAGKIVGSAQWPVKVIVPGARPLKALAGAFVSELGRGLGPLRRELEAGAKALHDLMEEVLLRQNRPEEAVFVLVVDQFEEVFTLCDDESERQLFLDRLVHACQIPNNRSFVFVTMRADFYAHAGAYKNLTDTITQNQMLVAPMPVTDIRHHRTESLFTEYWPIQPARLLPTQHRWGKGEAK